MLLLPLPSLFGFDENLDMCTHDGMSMFTVCACVCDACEHHNISKIEAWNNVVFSVSSVSPRYS